jgi:hypothetical protein
MRIQFKTEGGIAAFPGLSKPVTIDTNQLPKEEAAELERLVNTVRFFELPARARAAPPGAADYRQYTITVEDGGQHHTVQLDEFVAEPNLQALVRRLEVQAKAQRAAGGGP